MPRTLPVSHIEIWHLDIPMRRTFRHATAERTRAEPIIVAIELGDHTLGYGETHPRPYVSGETHESVIRTIRDLFLPRLLETRPASFGEAIEAAANLPMLDQGGHPVPAARAAVELALLDAYSRAFDRSFGNIPGWLEDPSFGTPGSVHTVRYGGVVSGSDAGTVVRTIRKMRLAALPHYKLKVGDDGEEDRLRAAVRALGRGLVKGRPTLRLDANAAWTADRAAERLTAWERFPITCVEQPLPKGDVKAWAHLAKTTNLPLMADESLVTADDAEDLIVHRAASWFNIRISKNGGLIPAMKLAAFARRHNIEYQLGCMVGETSILSAAGRWFLQTVPDVRFAEGSFGPFLLVDDVTRMSLRLGFAGRWKPMSGPGLGIAVDPQRLNRLSKTSSVRIPL